MNAILIQFGDNNFSSIWANVLRIAISDSDFFKIKDKKKLAFMFSHAAFGIYVLCKNRCQYNGLETYDHKRIIQTQNYLTISEENILLDEEVNEFLEKVYWDNSETVYVYQEPFGQSKVHIL